MNEWRPIETAPRNGTNVLLAHHRFKSITLGYWHEEWKSWATPSDHESPDVYPADMFTHWMPIPEPPK